MARRFVAQWQVSALRGLVLSVVRLTKATENLLLALLCGYTESDRLMLDIPAIRKNFLPHPC
jgi:hypothetical protein